MSAWAFDHNQEDVAVAPCVYNPSHRCVPRASRALGAVTAVKWLIRLACKIPLRTKALGKVVPIIGFIARHLWVLRVAVWLSAQGSRLFIL